MAAPFPDACTVADCSCLRMLWMRMLALLFMVPNLDGSRSRVLAQRRAACVAAVSCRTSREPDWGTTRRSAHGASGLAARIALDPGDLPHADRDGDDCDGALSWEN